MRALLFVVLTILASAAARAEAPSDLFQPIDVFDLEHASDPQLSPDGAWIAYVRTSGDVMADRFARSIWMVAADGARHRPLVQGAGGYTSPRWSPSGDRLLYVASEDGKTEIRALFMDTRQSATLAALQRAPGSLTWSPDGAQIAFSMFVEEDSTAAAPLPPAPKGAEWAEPAKVIDSVNYRFDGAGYLDAGHDQLFVLTAEGGTPRRLTFGKFNHDGPLSWTPDARALIFASNQSENWRYEPVESNVYELDIATGEIEQLTDRVGPDAQPALSPSGRYLAFTGFVDREQGYQVDVLSVLDRDTGEIHDLSTELDRSVYSPRWAPDGKSIYALYDDHGVTKLARFGRDGAMRTLASGLGGATLGRPYASASFSVGPDDAYATIVTTPARPGDVAFGRGTSLKTLTRLNDDLLAHKTLADAEPITVASSADGREVQAWVMRPARFDPSKTYPMILEIHGGPFANYGPRFSSEMQLYAAQGYVVVYANPRGSTSYGAEFGNLIHHNYPGEDYDDLMSVVDAAIQMGFVDPERLFVTGGSGGGVLTAWIVGNTDRFAAAVVAKPVINWASFALTADAYTFFFRYWFPGPPWEHAEHYWRRSPLSLVGNVETPTMLLTGEADYRTPISETEQYYQALKIRKVPTRMVRIPGASHGIAARPSRLLAKAANILAWFEEHDPKRDDDQSDE